MRHPSRNRTRPGCGGIARLAWLAWAGLAPGVVSAQGVDPAPAAAPAPAGPTSGSLPAPPAAPPPVYPAAPEGSGFLQAALDSMFGPTDPVPWTPLPLGTLFDEGWDEPWVEPPGGTGGAPRQGWIGAAEGNFYRVYWFSYSEDFHVAQGGNGYNDRFNLYTPLEQFSIGYDG